MGIARTQADLIRVEIDNKGNAIGDGSVKFNSAFPQIARSMVPITIPTWDHVPEQLRTDCWDAVKLRFDVDDRASYRAFQKMGIGWHAYKSKMTNQILEAGNNSRTLEFLKPLNVPTLEEWLRFAAQLLSDQHAKERKQKQELQAKNQYPHTMSRRGYGGTRREMKSDTPEAITRVDVWIEGHKRKDGSFVNEISKDAAVRMEEYTQTTQSSGVRDDALAAVIGPEHRGRVRGLGFGATLRQVNQQSGSSQICPVKFAAMERELQEQRRQQQEMMQMLQLTLGNKQSSPTAPPQVSPEPDIENVGRRCELLHYNGKGSVVAKGEVSSTDSNDEIGGAAIGDECWTVWITYVYESEVHLYRSMTPLSLLKEVLGKVITWPKKYIKITD